MHSPLLQNISCRRRSHTRPRNCKYNTVANAFADQTVVLLSPKQFIQYYTRNFPNRLFHKICPKPSYLNLNSHYHSFSKCRWLSRINHLISTQYNTPCPEGCPFPTLLYIIKKSFFY